MIHFLQNPEFWTSLAFVLVVVMAMRPAGRWVSAWAARQAEQIQARQKEADSVLAQAENLHQNYEQAYRHRMAERQKMLDDAEDETRALAEEAALRTADRMMHRRQEIDLRLKMVAENGRQDIKKQMLTRVIQKTKVQLENRRDLEQENTEKLVQQACQALELYAPALDQTK